MTGYLLNLKLCCVAERELGMDRQDTPKSAHPCAGSAGDVLSPDGPVDPYPTHSPSIPVLFSSK
jgi:hypothetical protein